MTSLRLRTLFRAPRRAGSRRRASVAVAGLAAVLLTASCGTGTDPDPAVMRVGPPPWDAPRDAVSYIDAAGMERLSFGHPVARTIRSNLEVVVDGAPVLVPANVGIDRLRAFEAALHTHFDDGVLWVESPHAEETATLGQFFDLWGVHFDERCLAGYCTEPDGAADPVAETTPAGRSDDPAAVETVLGELTVTSDGAPVTGDPRELVLTDGQRIKVEFATT